MDSKGLLYRRGQFRQGVFLQKLQHTDILSVALFDLPFQPASQDLETLRQSQVLQRQPMIQTARFTCQKRQIVHGIKDLPFLIPAACVFGDDLRAIPDNNPIGIPLDHHRVMGIVNGYRVIVRIEPYQGFGIGGYRLDSTGLERNFG